MKDFNLAKYLKEHNLGSHGILGRYVDLQALKEQNEKVDSEVTKTFKVNIDIEALGELDDEFAKRNNVEIEIPEKFKNFDPNKLKSLTPGERFMMSDVPVKFTGTADSLAALLNGDLAAQIYGDEDAYFNALNRLFKKPKNMNEEDGYGNNKPVSKAPYEGSDAKLDGFGDEFDQVDPVSELEKPEQIYSNDWMDDSIDNKKVGSWTCYFDDLQGVIYWLHDNINSEDVVVYATPGWDGAQGIACETSIESGEAVIEHETIGDNSYPDFESYAEDVAPYLKKIQDKHFAGELGTYLGGGAGEEANDVATIELDMGWDSSDPEEDAAVNAAFDKYGIEVQPINGKPGKFEVTGRKEDILAYLKSEFYGMDEEDIAIYYPELLDGENQMEEGVNELEYPSPHDDYNAWFNSLTDDEKEEVIQAAEEWKARHNM